MLKIKGIFQNNKEKVEFNFVLFLLLLLSADFIFVVIHFYYKLTHDMECSLFCLTTNRGYAEFFQYLKYSWIILLFIYILLTTKCMHYLSWILVFVFFIFDDAFQLHGRLGHHILGGFTIDPPLHLKLGDIGELLFFVLIGGILFGLLFLTYIRAEQYFRRVTIDLGIFMLLIVFFGVIVDIFHVAFSLDGVGLSFFEDAGEMVMMSLILWYVYMIAVSKASFYLDLPGQIRTLFTKS